MTERDITDSWSRGRARDQDESQGLSEAQQFGEAHLFNIPATGSNSKSVKRQTDHNSEELPFNSQSQKTISPNLILSKLPRWMQNWVLWLVILTLVPGGIAFLATAMLLKLPAAPNCPKIFWPLASESVRLHCAQLAASKQTVTDLLQAINLVKQLGKNHPLRGEADRFIERWSKDILQLADQSFQAGNLEEAIATAQKIPSDVPVYNNVEEQVAKWQSIWSKAEGIYQEAEAELRQRNWQSAFMLSAKLLRVDNKYWATTKYDELNRTIATAREDGEKLAKADNLAESGVAEKILEAIKLAESIGQNSYLYQKAQELIPAYGRKMLDLAQAKLDKRDADTALDIVRQIPENTKLQTEVEDFISLAEAQRSAWIGTIDSLQTAISQAQQIDPSRAVYNKAQQLIARWQLEIEDVAHLEKARTLASQGSVTDLTAAIAQTQLIPRGNPRASEARQEAGRWQAQVETIQDRPFLDRAEQIAYLEDINSLQAAIAEASQIRSGRALYSEARRKIQNWTAKIQRIQDQPYLDQARELAASGNLAGAISAAQNIASSGRALSGEAQEAINDWREQIRARDNWQKARTAALTGTPDALVEAIRLAQQVPRRNALRMDANVAIDQWSQQLLDIARTQGQSDIYKGIEIAKLVPRGSSAYSAAQQQIQTWREFLNPEPQPATPPTLSPSPSSTETPN
ncbi:MULTISPECIES: chromosome segregation ATPase [Calothrix]|uniref:Chromosome segregation ATPase n=2 Tax=Calothrix TaxID=1186 RepID=A0ABR8AJ11_9CYAN|nr:MULTISPECIES: chromosome segregation ATPase [Calothrix]MBD2200012.1 chromosome segregation ATPase [Calothrix parietina FACHB-288]MBD2227291.1 chromosome segregation ATPase [Calothrix anomala FACHB-343]